MQQKLTRAQYEATCGYTTKENCPFCWDFANHEILHRTEYWTVVFALYPYFDREWEHILAIPKRHTEFTSSLSKEEFWDFVEVEKFVQQFYQKQQTEYFSFIRESKSNKSIEHLHYHFLPGIPSSKLLDWEKYIKIKNGKK